MPRNAIIAVSAVLYVALSVWLVGKQGQAYRDGPAERPISSRSV